ncbi:alpha/beta fold hydrolase [Lachnoclostridium edouardi]|uniref:alpha/beta fold hydrolase n=1 Tax=Lachnoclostridium edouardi TaxID=1926283 RepID=UPI000C7B5D42|nr:alpha/beta hydrolase [Lachnoclostridium edouardi]
MTVVKKEYRILSSDGKSKLYIVRWEPKGAVFAVLHISHGMLEHIGRYEEFAIYLAKRGIAVIGHDHLGHGKSSLKENYGFFGENHGGNYLIRDIRRIRYVISRWYPDTPCFLMGHSMGSFLLRRYISVYPNQEKGIILTGTGEKPYALLLAGLAIVSFTGKIKGKMYRSVLFEDLMLGRFGKSFRPVKTASDWLSCDEEKVSEYVKDSMCRFHFTCSAYEDFLNILIDLKKRIVRKKCPSDLSVLLASGCDDPVGDKGKGVERVYTQMKKYGGKDISMILYSNCRHEILNEKNRIQVYNDLAQWILKRI